MKALKCILSRFVAIGEYNYSTICEDLQALILSIDRGCYFQEGGKINMTMDVETAFQKSIVTLVDWIGREVNMSKTKIFFRTYSPVHFRRRDGHLSLYYLGPKVGPVSPHKQDCSHWCLPGFPDSWNELLYAILLKQELAQEKISKSTSQSAE
ncbi:hypothetical protein MTR67_040569 [Solanum verrucosum]|uniref:Trichome birefringence-like C-terminal domain-containing protein n=1 Tax=Solanum verrucosum TaxID=315347 RepID=A0AAF0UJU1_SOLVR|nr:hypothetical protein MTR67_040569 [Solanum verrucosum]